MGLSDLYEVVSTHSRLKAAGTSSYIDGDTATSFNTQPPEGGWQDKCEFIKCAHGFNTQPPEGGWNIPISVNELYSLFQHTAA